MHTLATGRNQRRFYDTAYGPDRTSRDAGVLQAAIRKFELHRTDAVFRLLPKGGRMLDVGCAHGEFAMRCASQFDRVIGMDLVEAQIAAGQRRASVSGLHQVSFLVGNADDGFPLEDEQFDVVTAIAVLAMLFDPVAVIDELHRVLKPGGYLVLEVPNLAYLPRRVKLLVGRLPTVSSGQGWDGAHLHNFTLGALLDLLRRHGFHAEHCTGSGVLAPLRTWRPSLLTGNLIISSRKM